MIICLYNMGKLRRKSKPIQFTGKHYIAAKRLLLAVVDVLNKAGIDYMIDSGTLVGLAREGDLLPWDDDIDITLPERELRRFLRVLWRLRLKGCWISKRYMKYDYALWEKGDYQSIKIRNRRYGLFRGRIKVDVNIKYKADQHYYWFMLGTGMNCRVDEKYFDHYEEIEFAERKVKVPAYYDQYLTLKYGNWHVPQKDYDGHVSDGTAIGKGSEFVRASDVT